MKINEFPSLGSVDKIKTIVDKVELNLRGGDLRHGMQLEQTEIIDIRGVITDCSIRGLIFSLK